MSSSLPFFDNIARSNPNLALVLFVLGSLSLAKFAFKYFGVLLQTFVLPGKSLKKYGAGKGAWAVITGASEGIGREFALQLGSAGYNVFVAARNADALASLTAEIEAQGQQKGVKVQTKAVQMDFSKLHDQKAWQHFQSELAELDIGVLVNNVGKSHPYPEYYHDVPEEIIEDILAINVVATARVTRMIVPHMVQKRRGLILSLASFSGVSVPSPMLAPYAGSKSFLASFTTSLGEELKGKGIDVECANTYFVVSNMSKIRRSSMFIPTPKQYVRAVLSKIGLACGALWTGRPFLSTPYWSHALLDWLIHVIGWKMAFVRYTHNLHLDIRRRALRKIERESKKQ